MRQDPSFVARSSLENTPCDDKLLFFQLTVRGQRSVGRPQADVDRDEDEEDREEEDAGCRGGHSKELHPPTAAQPPAAGTRSLPGGAALPWEPRRRPRGTRVYYRRIDPRGRGPHPPAEGRACSSPPSRVREKQSQTTARSANCKCLVSVGRRLRAPLRVEVGAGPATQSLLPSRSRAPPRPGARPGTQRAALARPRLCRRPRTPPVRGGTAA
nr:uncharacterized protein LOC123282038 [Equus asinus]